MSLKRKILLGGLVIVFIVGGVSIWVALGVARNLSAARAALSAPISQLTQERINDARDEMTDAQSRLDGPAARLLSVVPVVRQNLEAVRAAVDGALPLLDRSAELQRAVGGLDERPLIQAGTVDLQAIADLERPLRRQIESLEVMASALREHRTGWLLPPVWDELNSTLARIEGVERSARSALEATRVAGPLLGSEEKRTYLVVLLNNAELRGAGGIPSGAGTITAENGRLSLGEFSETTTLRGPPPYEKVPAPADFERRFGRYGADTTLWVNSTFSPDVPDDAAVLTELYGVARNVEIDGVLLADPLGIAALLPPRQEIEVPTVDSAIAAQEIPEYVMSTAYEELGGGGARKEILLGLGAVAFNQVANQGIGGFPGLLRAGEALGAGHLRFVPADDSEAATLRGLGVTGAMQPPESDAVVVVAHNTGGDKLDYWTRRHISHRCTVSEDVADCITEVTIDNQTPAGLSRYVANRPYGLLRNFIEIYIPQRASLDGAEVDGEATNLIVDRQDGFSALGFEIRLARGRSTALRIGYSLPLDESYELEVLPQPLARDAELEVRLDFPAGWIARGPNASDDSIEYRGRLSGNLLFEARPSLRTGLSAWWDDLRRFLAEPVI